MPGPIIAVEVAQVAEVKLQGVDQRAAPVPLGRVHHHVGRLVDDGEVLVLVEDFERDVLGDRHGCVGSGRHDADLVAGAHLVAGLGRRSLTVTVPASMPSG